MDFKIIDMIKVLLHLQLKYNLPCVMGHTGIRYFIKWNVLEHKDGVEYSNGVYDWDETGKIIQVQTTEDVDHSIILTVHNKGWLLPRVLDGIKQNTTGSYELIVVLDGCTDDSESILNDFVKSNKDIKIKTVHTPDVFETKANNAGLKEAEGDKLIIVQMIWW